MTNPFGHASSGLPPEVALTGFIPRARSSYASVASGDDTTTPSSSNPPFSRLSHFFSQPYETPDIYSNQYSPFRSYGMDLDRAGLPPDGAATSPAPRIPQLPSFSRAFEMFMNGASDSFWSSQHRNNGFFVPSYLRGTNYIEKLEAAHQAKQAQKESQQVVGGGASMKTSQSTTPSVTTKPPSHLGMTYDLIERASSFADDNTVAPLPTGWNKDDKHPGLEVMGDGQEVKYTAPKQPGERDYETGTIRADHPIPPQTGIYYFEVTVLSRKRDETTICVGFEQNTASLARPPGWESDSYGYHGDDGHMFSGANIGKHYGPTFGTGDTIGCGINFKTGCAFFTKNGVNLGVAIRELKGKFYPAVGLKRAGEHIRVNFGQTPFVYDIDSMMKQEQDKIRKAISETSTDKLVSPPVSETELIQQLVLQFLQHDGYVETAKAFADEIRAEKEALSLDPTDVVNDVNIQDDEDANRRQRIRRAILEGDIDKALKYTNAYYPHVLKENEQVYFRLRCRKFIEMVRRSAEPTDNGPASAKSNGHTAEDTPNAMDVDENGVSDNMMETEDGLETSTAGQAALLEETVAYGRQLAEEFKGDPRREVSKALNEVFSLMAYRNPFEVKEVAHLLNRRGRVAVAEELNSAILQSLGKSSRSALENLYGQTSVLLDYLREDGGAGSFVTIQSVIDEIPKQQPF